MRKNKIPVAMQLEQEQFAIGPMESAKTCIDNIRKLGR